MVKHKLFKIVRKGSVRTLCGIFILEFSECGLYRVKFPKQYHFQPMRCDIAHLVGGIRFNGRLDLGGYTEFQKKVYRALLKVPSGKTITYGELAKRAGYPGAARAVGTAMRMNRLPIVIPCHRVVPSTGGIGQYSAGVKWKRFLLSQESVSKCLCAKVSLIPRKR